MAGPVVKKKEKKCTRYGPVTMTDQRFGKEERFRWQKAGSTSDVSYQLPSTIMTRSSQFGTDVRRPLDDGDARKSSTGPGSYNPGKCANFVSMYVHHQAQRFSSAPRGSMDMKTPSPGAVYNLGQTYWNGPVKSLGIGFNCDERKPLSNGDNCTKDADMFMPKPTTGTARTIAGRLKYRTRGDDTPGAIYEIGKYERKGGPAFTFGKGRGDRFSSAAGMLKEDF